MPTGYAIPSDVRKKIYTAHCLGESNASIAERLGVSVVTIRKIVRTQRKEFEKEREDMARSGKIVKKDGRGGKLMALPGTGFEFTHVTPDGKSHKKKIDGHYAHVAESQYDAWCQQLDDECEFMRKVERKEYDGFVPSDEEVDFFEDNEPKVVCGYPGDPVEEIHPVEEAPVPDIEVRPWREVAEERQKEIDELKARIAELEQSQAASATSNPIISDTEKDEPVLAHWFNNNGSFFVTWEKRPVYALWAKCDQPKFFGVYRRMEDALKKLDELNEVAAFLGNDGAFEIEELVWKA